MRDIVISLVLATLLVGSAPPAVAQSREEQPSSTPRPIPSSPTAIPADPDAIPTNGSAVQALDPDALPVSLDRIQRRLSRPPAIRPESTRHVFRVEVFGRNPTIDEILGPNWRKGPTPYGAMSHQEFLSVVTPKDVQGYAMYDNKQAMVVAATSFAMQWALRQAVKKLDDARTERQQEAAQKEVNEALAALRRARRDAGLPDK